MSEQVQTGNGNAKRTGTLKKVSVTQIKLSEQLAGYVLEGKFLSLTSGQDDEGKLRYTMIVENDKGERIKFFADAGLRTQIEDAMVQPNDWFRAVKGEKKDIGQGKTMNVWEVYQYV